MISMAFISTLAACHILSALDVLSQQELMVNIQAVLSRALYRKPRYPLLLSQSEEVGVEASASNSEEWLAGHFRRGLK
jgi:hypothetical protein